MKGISVRLRLGLLALAAALAIGGGGGGVSLAGDAFDSDYDDCPVRTRLDAIDGLTVDRTDDAQKIRVSWNALDVPALGLAGNAYSARITVIVEDDEMNLALGDTSVEFKDVSFTKDLTVSAALTIGKMVISDIAEADFTSGLPKPSFSGTIRALEDMDVSVAGSHTTFLTDIIISGTETGDFLTNKQKFTLSKMELVNSKNDDFEEIDFGDFYYLGFNSMFDNWYVSEGLPAGASEKPATSKFRVGLRHGAGSITPADADFDHFRITIEDSNGDLLGYNAQTVEAAGRYGNRVGIVFGEVDLSRLAGLCDDGDFPGKKTTNVRLSTEASGGPRAPYYDSTTGCDGVNKGAPVLAAVDANRSFGNPLNFMVEVGKPLTSENTNDWPGRWAFDWSVGVPGAVGITNDFNPETGDALPHVLYAPDPEEYYDFPVDVFDRDGNYTFKAWAEDEDGVRISPQTSLKLNVAFRNDVGSSFYDGYGTGANIRSWGEAANEPVTELKEFNLSIQG